MTDRLPSLDRPIVEALRAPFAAPAEARARVRSRLEAALPVMRRDGSEPSPSAARAAGGFASHALTVAAFVVGGVSGAAMYAHWAGRPQVQIVYVDRPSPEPGPAPRQVLPPPAAPAEVPTATVDADMADASAQPGPRVLSTPAPGPRGPSQLSAERALLDEARAAINDGDTARALERVDRHRRLYPKALLAEERDAMEIEALAQAHRYDEARVRADAFEKSEPDSLFLPSIEAALRGAPEGHPRDGGRSPGSTAD